MRRLIPFHNQPVPGNHMKKLLAALIVGSFAFAGFAVAQEKKAESKKPTAEECKKAAEAKKELAGCEKPAAKK
jgi:hypothetical protein